MSAFAKHLILGQGIAGTTLAHTLLSRGESVWIVDDGFSHSSSMVAAGIWNPIVFKRMNKSWMADECIPAMYSFYREIEKKINQSFFHPLPIYRMHGSKQESDLWFEKKTLPGYAAYMESNFEPEIKGFKKPKFGSCEVSKTGFVDVDTFLKSSRTYFKKQAILTEAKLVTESCLSGKVQIGDTTLQFENVIDCRGAKSAEEELWQFLPFNLTKGEVLTIEGPSIHLKAIYNSGGFMLPVSDEKYKVGATFEWKDLDPTPTAKGKDELVSKISAWSTLPYKIVGHNAGIRPTVKDRRPLLGRHPSHHNFLIFNGLGAKGIMLAPFLAKKFSEYLISGNPLDKSFDISRFL
jgi:glycine/D-amino acid oxidase-like deaminating enzyme